MLGLRVRGLRIRGRVSRNWLWCNWCIDDGASTADSVTRSHPSVGGRNRKREYRVYRAGRRVTFWATSAFVHNRSPVDDLSGMHCHGWTQWAPVILRSN